LDGFIQLTWYRADGCYLGWQLSSFIPIRLQTSGRLEGALKAGSTNTVLRKILVVSQFAISIVMIVGTITVYNQLDYIRNMKLGFDKDHVINMPMANIFMAQRYEETFKQAITQHPDIIAAMGASSMPGDLFNTATVHLPAADDEDNRSLEALGVDYDYFPITGIELAAGRNFSLELGTDPGKAIIINETAVQTLGLTDPVGKTIEFGRNQNARTVVGVVKDFHLKSIHKKLSLWLYSHRHSPVHLVCIH